MTLSSGSGEEKQRKQAEGPVFAKTSDIPQLIQICKDSFKDSVRWQGLRKVAQRWWINALSSNFAEVYVFRCHDKAAAFCLLIINEAAHKIQMNQRKIPLWLRLISAIMCPHVSLKQMAKKIQVFLSGRNKTDDAAVHIPWQLQDRSWVELIAVNPLFRGKGYAAELLKYCEQRSAITRKKAIVLKVDSDNRFAQNLYKKMGYYAVAEKSDDAYYAKVLTVIENRIS